MSPELATLLEQIDAALSAGDPKDVGDGWETYDALTAIETARKLIAAALESKGE